MGINRKDWSFEVLPDLIEINRTYDDRKVWGRITLPEAKKIAERFLSWYYDWLIEYEPKATGSHAEINNILGLLQGDLNEVLRTE